jgi:cell division protein FtsL
MSPRRRYTRNEKVFYILSLLIVFSMVLSLIYVAIMPN